MFANHINRMRSGFIVGAIAVLLVAFPCGLFAQSPLTVQPSTGRVGVGTTTPSETLEVSGTVKATSFKGDGSQLTNLTGGGQWTTNGSNIYYNTGNIGIGTTSPAGKVDVRGGGFYLGDRGDGIAADSRMGSGGQETHFYSYGSGYGSGRFGIHKYGTGSAQGEVFTILPNGNIGIGTTSPNQKLDVNGTAWLAALQVDSDRVDPSNRYFRVSSYGSDGVIRVNPGPTSTIYINREVGAARDLHIWNGNTGTVLFTQGSTGNVGIGTEAPGNILTIQQNSATEPIADAWTTYSSRRWKTNIQLLSGAIDKVQRLRGVSFDWKANGKHDVGLIAEEVGQVIPEVVAYEENGKDAKSVDYARLVAVLIEAVKEQQEQIGDLRTQIEGLRGRIKFAGVSEVAR